MRTATITKIKGLSIQTQQNTFVLFTLFQLTLDERKTLTKISTRKTSHNRSPNQHTPQTTKKQGENPPLKGKQQVTEKSCLQHPTLDPDTQNNNNQNEPQPGPSGQMSKKPDKYQTMEYIVLHLKSYEFNFFQRVVWINSDPVNAYGLACITNLPDPTFAHIRHEHTKFGLTVKEIHGRNALHILGIWYLQAKDKSYIIPMIMEMFRAWSFMMNVKK